MCVCLRTLFSEGQGDDDSKHRSGPTLRQWHAGALAALASQRDAEQRQGTARLLPRAFGALLQRKCLVQEGTNARWLFLFFCLQSCVRNLGTEHASVSVNDYYSYYYTSVKTAQQHEKICDQTLTTWISEPGKKPCMQRASR